MQSSVTLSIVTEDFIAAVERALQSEPLVGNGPLYEATLIGNGGNGFVLRGYVHVHDSGSEERVRWLVVKAPLPYERAPGNFVQRNVSLRAEHRARIDMGAVPGLGPIPALVEIPEPLVRRSLPDATSRAIELRPTVVVLVFDLRDARVVEVPPGSAASCVRGAVTTARDLYNWCEIARVLGNALLSLHDRLWIHRDVKLSNVVAQSENGFWRSVELIDLGSATEFGERADPPREVGATTVGTRSYWRPERLDPTLNPGGVWTPPSPVDEDVYAYASLLARVLLGRLGNRNPDSPLALEIDNLVGNVVYDQVTPVGAQIQSAFNHTGELMRRYHLNSVEPLSAFLREVERIRVAALDEMTSQRPPTVDGLGLVPNLLAKLETYVDRDQEERWVERYRRSDRAGVLADLDRAGQPPSVALAADLLRAAYVNVARGVLDELLTLPAGPATDEDARAVRLHVGQILLREGDDERGRRVLGHYEKKLAAGPHCPALAWWTGMLRARLAFRVHEPVSLDALEVWVPEPRSRVWLDALRAQIAIREGTPVAPAIGRRLLDEARRTPSSTSERLFTLLLLALTLAQRGELVQALQWLNTGIGEASARDFPIEHADMLVGAAQALLLCVDRDDLARHGVDVKALFKTAEHLAIHAADLLHRMGVGIERDHALRVACRCAKARGGADGITAAVRWHEPPPPIPPSRVRGRPSRGCPCRRRTIQAPSRRGPTSPAMGGCSISSGRRVASASSASRATSPRSARRCGSCSTCAPRRRARASSSWSAAGRGARCSSSPRCTRTPGSTAWTRSRGTSRRPRSRPGARLGTGAARSAAPTWSAPALRAIWAARARGTSW